MPSLLEDRILLTLEIPKEFGINNSLVSVSVETQDPLKLVLQALAEPKYFTFLNAALLRSELDCQVPRLLLLSNKFTENKRLEIYFPGFGTPKFLLNLQFQSPDPNP